MQEKRAFLVAVETYQSPGIQAVYYAEADALDLAAAFEILGYSRENVEVLLSHNATKTTIESRLRRFLRRVKTDDQVVLFYAGHGFSANDRNFLTCCDTQPGDLIHTSVSLQDLLHQFRSSSSRTMLLLDSCHSGMEINAGMRGI